VKDGIPCPERLYFTEDRKRLVKEGDPKGAFLYAPKGREVSQAELQSRGYKGAKPEGDKAAKPEGDKGAK